MNECGRSVRPSKVGFFFILGVILGFRRVRISHLSNIGDITMQTMMELVKLINLFKKTPGKRIKNTYCLFNLTIQLHCNQTTCYKTCHIYIKWNQNHPLVSLELLSFNYIATITATEVRKLFEK